MARLGVANYCHSDDCPLKSERVWKETLQHERRSHIYGTSDIPVLAQRSNYSMMTTTSKEMYGRTWKARDHASSYAAGVSSYHHNVSKPLGQPKANTASNNFERLPAVFGASSGLRGSASTGSLRLASRTLNPAYDAVAY
mmetsp:Transcript_66959/g.160376  ORF Transcript_66959/g.160376 Transcript_66959/m.160376 type:complete len:140 (-) Transcript_66959:68-487(-)